MSETMSIHNQCLGATDEWYTPPYVFHALGVRFAMDVASPGPGYTPWIDADYFVKRDSLTTPWRGFIWMNPPFGGRNGLVPWLNKFFENRNGIALTPDRTSAPWWQTFAAKADAILFVSPKIKFIDANGLPGPSPADGTTLMAAGLRGVKALERAADNGLGLLTRPIASRCKNWAGECQVHCGQDYCSQSPADRKGEA
jgi:DNA N-6-adenine-methyltransferase Dam